MSKSQTPYNRAAFIAAWPAFKAWLVAHGSEILRPTNPYELARFTVHNGTGIVYCDGKGQVLPEHWQNGAQQAWSAHQSGDDSWRACRRTFRKAKDWRQIEAILERDGNHCFFGGLEFTADRSLTLEHIVPISHGGPNHLSNLVLACRPCNEEAGHMCAKEKFDLATFKRANGGCK